MFSIRLILAVFLGNWIGVAFAGDAAPVLSNYVYELRTNNGQVSYVYGSAHASASRAPVHLGQCVKNLLAASTAVYLESDQLAIRTLLTSAPKTVSMELVVDFIDKATLDSLRVALFGPGQEGESRIKGMDANVLLNVLTSRIPGSETILGIQDYGVDTEIEMAARFLNIPVAFVETPDDQFYFLRSVSPKAYAEAIVAAFKLLNDKEGGADYYRSMLKQFQAAAAGDEKALLDSLDVQGFSGFYMSTVPARNSSLARKVDSLASTAEKSPIFIALGAAHLAGEDSVVRRLSKRGYQVTRLCQ